ncbi:binding-protein-dependent transport systems inner membrane component [Kribbella flavida DSM 17836]|uniref:Binding-protein-dependent transport systems inner membrane component n=1 Tax=Kribbella flavida (strain DSM 17836 / JCM 10339 / NBRC 14399) TaxID=479435 RepID=D2Q457_KRIFD|nr:sugar ABC transporter permease [Kribbella flavida]ADB30371.1 binding-protein-dependent transport systems inner membrane component [Kribbella flavida DSM 17836]
MSSSAQVPAVPPARGRKPKRQTTFDEGTGRLAAILLSPTLLVLALVVVYPIISALRESLYTSGQRFDEDGFVIEGSQFVGLDNYTAIFSGETGERFWNAFYNTTFFTITCVLLETVLGVGMALVMHKAFKGRGIVRASILVPWAIPTVVSALLWKWIFQADGAANALLGQQILWSTEGWQSVLSVIVADTWKTAPFIGLLVLAGLQTIPDEVYEAAKVDGASPWQQFVRITLPLVKPALLVAVLFRILDTLRIFDLPYVLVGANKESVETLSMLAFDEASNTRYGPAAAYATILFLYVAVVAYVFVKLLGADVLGDAVQKKKTNGRKKRRNRDAAPPGASTTALAGANSGGGFSG